MTVEGVPVLTAKDSPRAFLDTAYTELEFDRGVLLPATKRPDPQHADEWLEKGDWQALAAEVHAEKIFFVDREPVVVFAELRSSDDTAFRETYNRIWSMARPQLLFLARPGELSVYDLGKPPVKSDERFDHCRSLLYTTQTLAGVQAWRKQFHRELIETGAIFGEEHFGKGLDRADRALIRDLRTVRRELNDLELRADANLDGKQKTALLHSFIGRAIFIRYLEDRKIITRDYFDKVVELHAKDATQRKDWNRLLDQPLDRPNTTTTKGAFLFAGALSNKEFAHALFEQLAHDFNGDTFPFGDDEKRFLLQHHFNKLRDFLLGVVSSSGQPELFFFAYDFNVIPIELISSIYEEFYNEHVGDAVNQGSHYTPPALVEFVLANTLTRDVLRRQPRVLDPACGSGIFLVETFRRMVRYFCVGKESGRLTRSELRAILRKQIAGMDINEEAVRVAAFSLYLAFLHYQHPREILPDPREDLAKQPGKLRTVRLPHLKWLSAAEKRERETNKPGVEFFDTLLAASAFDPVMGKCDSEVTTAFGPGSADIIVGNPPWGDPKPKTEREKQAVDDLKAWCDASKGRPVGDNERSQAFIHLTLSLLKEGGRAGLLISSGVFFKHQDNSKAFRKVWLEAVQLRQVVNFAHVRQVYFSGTDRKTKGISPFASVVFDKVPLSAAPDTRFDYWSAKRTVVVENTKAVVLTRGDMNYLRQRDCLAYEKLWKIYWWGGYQDEALVKVIERFPTLIELSKASPQIRLSFGRGFEVTKKGKAPGWLANYQELPSTELKRYGRQDLKKLRAVPGRVYRRGEEKIYSGHRLLVGRGIKEGGFIISRLETERYCFRNSIHGVRLDGLESWQTEVLIGIFWSSLARYYYFTTAGSWGFWHYEIHLEDVEQLPVRFPTNNRLRERIGRIVGQLRELDLRPEGLELAGMAAQQRLTELERQLDEAIFDLYELNAAERDLVREMCSTGLDLFYRDQTSDAVRPVCCSSISYGTLADVAQADADLPGYLRVFLEWWNPQLAPNGEFAWRVLAPKSKAPLLAVMFETRSAEKAKAAFDTSDDEAWEDMLGKLAEDARMPAGGSQIFIDPFFRAVTEHEILIVKRNERRFWTKSAARDDAEATMLKLIVQQEDQRKR